MSDNTKIEWTDATWNIITGCSVVSSGCKNCYAMKLAGTRLKHHPSRAGLTNDTKNGPVWNGEVRFNQQWLDQPLRWSKPRMIFVCAHGDLFHESVPDEWIDKVFAVMALASQHTFQVLTKRPKRMRKYLTEPNTEARIALLVKIYAANLGPSLDSPLSHPTLSMAPFDGGTVLDLPIPVGFEIWPLPNVWLGVSVENQEAADKRIIELLQTPAAARWISAEPLLGGIDLSVIPNISGLAEGQRHIDALRRYAWECDGPDYVDTCNISSGIDWIVVGGESGDGARPMHPAWPLSLRDQCAAAGVPFLFKQWGDWRPICEGGGDWYEQFYKPNRPAKDGEDQAALDDIYGKTCTVARRVIHLDGSLYDPIEPMAFRQDAGAMTTFRVGKKAAGRLLDGVTHDGYPERSK